MTDNNINTELNFEDDPILNEVVENAASQIDNTQTAVDAVDNTSIDWTLKILYHSRTHYNRTTPGPFTPPQTAY